VIAHFNGILLKNTKYGDTDLISQFFTQEQGLITVLTKGVRKNNLKKNNTIGLYQLLSPCELVLSYKLNADIFYGKEIRNVPPIAYLNSSPFGNFVTTYLAALIAQFSPPFHQDVPLFHFVSNYIKLVESIKPSFTNIALHFTVNFLEITGFLPSIYQSESNQNTAIQASENLKIFNQTILICCETSLINIDKIGINAAERKITLDFLVHSISEVLQQNRLSKVYHQLKDLLK